MPEPTIKLPLPPAKAAGAMEPSRRFPAWLLFGLLVSGTIVLYWPATHFDFLNFDDPAYVTDNPHTQAGLNWESIKWAFSSSVASNWHPLTMLSLMADCQFFGLKAWGLHLVNVLLHSLNAGLVFVLLRSLTGAKWRSLMVAALFALHPLRIESVAWISERKDVLSGFFGLLTLIFYARYAGKRSVAESRQPGTSNSLTRRAAVDYLLAFSFLALGLMSKPMLVTWPFVMLLLDFWPLKRLRAPDKIGNGRPFLILLGALDPRRAGWLVLEKIPFFVLVALSSLVTFIVQKRAGAVVAVESVSLGSRSANALVSYCRYLQKTFWPSDLSVFYPFPGRWPPAIILGAGLLLVGLSIVLWRLRRRYPFLLTGWLWFCGTLVPVIGLVQVGGQAIADRYTYLPSLGIFILIVWGIGELVPFWRRREIALWSAAFLALLVCFALTRQQLGYWKDSETLFRHAIAVTKDNAVAHDNLANALVDQNQIDAAISEYREAIRFDAGYSEPRHNLGAALARKGQTDEAIHWFQEALRLKPDDADAHYSLGLAFAKKGENDESIRQYREAIRLKPDDVDARYSLGTALGLAGQIDEAIRQFQEIIRLQPNHAEVRNNLGNALLAKGQIDPAISQFQEALRLEPDRVGTRDNLAIAFEKKGETNEALLQLREAVRLEPDYFDTRNNLGDVLYRQGQLEEAVTQFREAVRLRPNDALAQRKLTFLLALKTNSAPVGR